MKLTYKKTVNKENEYLIRWVLEYCFRKGHRPYNVQKIATEMDLPFGKVVDIINETNESMLIDLGNLGFTREILWELADGDIHRTNSSMYKIMESADSKDTTTTDLNSIGLDRQEE